MLEQEVQNTVALFSGQLVNLHRITWVGVKNLLASNRVRQKNRMRNRRLGLALRLSQRGPCAARLFAHVFPELIEVMQDRLAFKFAFYFFG